MKKFFISLLLVASIFFLISCQSEEAKVNSDNSNLTDKTQLTNLLCRVAKNPASVDNIIDDTSCFNVNFPVAVIVNGKNVTLSSEADYVLVKNIFNESSDDVDEVVFVFPITITFSDYSTAQVTSQNQLKNIIENCDEKDNEKEIKCISINYPITISYYNSGTQASSIVTINSDVQLYNFFDDFKESDYAKINYPISVINADGNQVVVKNNSELESVILAAESVCKDENGDPEISPNFISTIQSGVWHISYFLHESEEITVYHDYNFTFGSNGVLGVALNTTNLSGEWKAYIHNDQNILELKFSTSPLNELSEDWEIIEYSTTQIRLKKVDGNNGEINYLTFSKN